MKKMNLTKIAQDVKNTAGKYSPEILTGFGIAGMLTAIVVTAKATPKALKCIEAEKERQNRELSNLAKEQGTDIYEKVTKLKPWDVAKVTWKCYVPTAVLATASTVCLIGATSVNAKRTAALATAYKISETALHEYREKVIETIGEKKEEEVRDKVAQQKLADNPVSSNTVIITSKGNTLCYDAFSGRYFRSDIEKIRRAENTLNRLMFTDMYVSLNEFYDELELEHTDIGQQLGWNMDDGLLEIDFSSQLTEDGEPCLVISYNHSPKYEYSTLMY